MSQSKIDFLLDGAIELKGRAQKGYFGRRVKIKSAVVGTAVPVIVL